VSDTVGDRASAFDGHGNPMGAISQAILPKAATVVGAINMNRRVALADEVFAHQPSLLASVRVQQRIDASLQQMEVLFNILVVANQAMKTFGRGWPLISEATGSQYCCVS
jgi:hypothetical protein